MQFLIEVALVNKIKDQNLVIWLRGYIFPRKILLPELFKYENTTLHLFQGEYLFRGGSTYLLVNTYWGSSYFAVKIYWGSLFFWEYLLMITPESSFNVKNISVNIKKQYETLQLQGDLPTTHHKKIVSKLQKMIANNKKTSNVSFSCPILVWVPILYMASHFVWKHHC